MCPAVFLGGQGHQLFDQLAVCHAHVIYFPLFQDPNKGIEGMNELESISSYPFTGCLSSLNSITSVVSVKVSSRFLILCS